MRKDSIAKRLRDTYDRWNNPPSPELPEGAGVLLEAAERIELLEHNDSEASNYVESVICMRTGFTGDPPYVGWKGLGLALTQALDERDELRKLLK